MPYEFLNDNHLAQYGRFTTDPTPDQLIDCYRLTSEDHKLAHAKLEAHNRLGLAVQLKTDEAIRLERVNGILTPVVTSLESLPESPSLTSLDANMTSRLPEIDLSELLLEVNAATGFCDAMVLASQGNPRLEYHAQGVCAVLVAQACNIGLKAVSQPGNPALNLGRLAWVQQNYVRSDTILNANAWLVEAHSKLPIVQRWGGGEVASGGYRTKCV